MRHPKVAEAQIVGVPDAFMGEELVALLKLKAGEPADEARAAGILPREHPSPESAEIHSLCGVVSADGERQDAEVCFEGTAHQGTRP